ncbi:MAG: replicative DNA helicase [Firmicutes bacterium]|nr:replicative DNA helicase [Bacillota bacterium]
MGIMLDKVPPQSLEAEQSVLGSMLLDKDAIIRAQEVLRPDDFYRDAHRLIYQTICDLFNKGEAVDLVTLAEELKRRGALEELGGAAYLTTLANVVPTAANIEHYAHIVEEKATLRALINASSHILAKGYQPEQELDAILDEAERSIFDISQRRIARGYEMLRDVLDKALDHIEFLYAHKGEVTGVPTGFKDLDDLTSGLQPSDLFILAARPSMGKTQLGLNFVRYAAVEKKIPSAIFSLEMSKEQLAVRFLAAEGNIDSQRLRTGHLTEEHWQRLTSALARLSEAPILIDDTPAITIMELRARARRMKAEHGLGLIMVDYLQLMTASRNKENRQQEISEISRSLKALARELHIPVLALSQLSRSVESRTDKRPMLSDLRESGSIEQDADVVSFIYRDDYYNRESEKPNITEIILAKQRNGPVGVVELVFLKEFGKFVSIDKHHGGA